MRKYIIFMSAIAVAGCSLSEAPKCVPGSKRCETDSVLHSTYYSECSDEGRWVDTMSCPVCDGNHCGQLDMARCHEEEDEDKCQTAHDVSIMFSCSHENWIPHFCPGGCEEDHCKPVANTSCEEGEVFCMDMPSIDASMEFACSSGNWVSKYCAAGKVCDGSRCGENGCEDGGVQCIMQSGVGKIYTCVGGKWNMTKDCKAACDGNACAKKADCKGTETKCVEESGVGKIYTCDEGEWKLTNDCKTAACDGNACARTVDCEGTETKCVEESGVGKIYTCDEGAWKLTNDCKTAGCNGNACGTCVNNAKSCIGMVSVQCKDDRYELVETCEAPAFAVATCADGACDFDCDEGYCKDGSACVSKQTSASHCGKCGKKCGTGQICYMGECVENACASGEKYLTRKVMTMTGEKTIKAYCINSLSDLIAMRSAINQFKAYPDENNTDNAYVLTTDLTITDASWESIGTVESYFKGYFLGNNHTVTFEKPLNVSSPNYYGFLGVLHDTTVTGLNLSVTLLAAVNMEFVGGMIGGIENGYVSDCHVTVKIHSNDKTIDYVGGLIGNSVRTTIDNCFVESPLIAGRNFVGGIVGTFGSSGVISNSYFSGKVSGEYKIGGIAGYCQGSQVADSKSDGEIIGKVETGGICGSVSSGYDNMTTCDDGAFKHLYSGMKITGHDSVGGIFGNAESICVLNSYASGDITVVEKSGGGLFGDVNVFKVYDSYATGNVTGIAASKVGGFVGSAGYNTEFVNSAAFGDVTGMSLTGGFIGYSFPDASYCAGGHPFENCFATGNVLAKSPTETEGAGGFLGGYKMTARCYNLFENCYSLGKVQQGGELLYSGNFIGTVIPGASGMKPVFTNCYALKSLDKDIGVYETLEARPEFGEIKVSDYQVKAGDESLRDKLGESWKSYRCVMSDGVLAPYCTVPLSSELVPDFCRATAFKNVLDFGKRL